MHVRVLDKLTQLLYIFANETKLRSSLKCIDIDE